MTAVGGRGGIRHVPPRPLHHQLQSKYGQFLHGSLKFCYTLVIARSAWKNQFVLQRRTFQRKFSEFWSNAVESQHTNPRGLWRVVNDILKPPLEVQTKNLSVVLSETSGLTFTTRLLASVAQQQTHLRRPSPLDLLLHSLCLTQLQSRRSLFSSRTEY